MAPAHDYAPPRARLGPDRDRRCRRGAGCSSRIYRDARVMSLSEAGSMEAPGGGSAMEAPSEESRPLRAVVWRRHQDNASMEYAVLSRLGAGYEIRGDIVAAHEGDPLLVS